MQLVSGFSYKSHNVLETYWEFFHGLIYLLIFLDLDIYHKTSQVNYFVTSDLVLMHTCVTQIQSRTQMLRLVDVEIWHIDILMYFCFLSY